MAEQPSDREHGAALVEFALILPLFMMLILGMFTGGIAYNQKLSLTHAAREGARYGATVPASQTFTSGTWAENVRTLIVDRGTGELAPATGATVCVSLVEGSANTGNLVVVSTATRPQSDFSTNGSLPCRPSETYSVTATDKGRRVQVVVTRPAKLEALLFSRSILLTSNATARSESV
jgi:Flp pilus assembly protein TadG